MNLLSAIKRLRTDNRGLALIEFAITFPVLFLLLFGGIELARYILIVQKVEKAAYQMTSVISRFSDATEGAKKAGEISDERVDAVFPALHSLMAPYSDIDEKRYRVIFTSIVRNVGSQSNGDPQTGGHTYIRWQRFKGTLDSISIVTGAAPDNNLAQCTEAKFTGSASVATELANMFNGENIIVGEVSYKYRPIIASLFPVTDATLERGGFSLREQTITRRYFLHPRQGTLLHLPDVYPFNKRVCPAPL